MFERNSYTQGPSTPVTLNLIIINVLFFLATFVLGRMGVDLDSLLGMHYWEADSFHPWQMITYMFMHANLSHIFFNMFSLYMFGRLLEMVWGGGRYLLYYLVTGVGAAITQQLAWMWQISGQIDQLNLQNPGLDLTHGAFIEYYPYLDQFITVGASGAIFGVLLAFGMMFPNAELMLLFPPIPLKAKWLVIGYGVVELVAGVAGTTGDNVAHFAHLGGMLFGFLLIMMWRHNRRVNF